MVLLPLFLLKIICFICLKGIYICLYLQYHDALEQQNVRLIAVTKRLYYCNNMRQNGGKELKGRRKGIKWGKPLYLHSSIMEKNNKNLESCSSAITPIVELCAAFFVIAIHGLIMRDKACLLMFFF